MSFTRIIIAALVLAAALPAWAAGAQDLRSPDAASLRMQVQRDRNAPDPPPIVQDLRTSNTHVVAPAPDPGPAPAPHEAFPWLEAGLLGALALMLAGGALAVTRRHRVVARS